MAVLHGPDPVLLSKGSVRWSPVKRPAVLRSDLAKWRGTDYLPSLFFPYRTGPGGSRMSTDMQSFIEENGESYWVWLKNRQPHLIRPLVWKRPRASWTTYHDKLYPFGRIPQGRLTSIPHSAEHLEWGSQYNLNDYFRCSFYMRSGILKK